MVSIKFKLFWALDFSTIISCCLMFRKIDATKQKVMDKKLILYIGCAAAAENKNHLKDFHKEVKKEIKITLECGFMEHKRLEWGIKFLIKMLKNQLKFNDKALKKTTKNSIGINTKSPNELKKKIGFVSIVLRLLFPSCTREKNNTSYGNSLNEYMEAIERIIDEKELNWTWWCLMK